MALPILDGNQTATTLSTVLTSGEHIPAHTVVSLGSVAISNITSAVSGSVVSVSNFPSTQTIAGTVTANLSSSKYYPSSSVTAQQVVIGYETSGGSGFSAWAESSVAEAVRSGVFNWADSELQGIISSATPVISGTVTANVYGLDVPNGTIAQIPVHNYDEGFAAGNKAIPVLIGNENGGFNSSQPLPISGTVTANLSQNFVSDDAGTIPNYAAAIGFGNESGDFSLVRHNAPLPISGTVTANNPNGALTTRFGSVTTANTAQITSAVTNTNRKYLLAQNISAGTVTIGIGFSPTTTQGIQLPAGGGLTFDAFCPTGAVYWLGAVTGAAFTILEG